MDFSRLKDKTVVIHGLGLHGGGVSAAKFCSEAGAKVIVTDLKKEQTLSKSIDQLKNYPITFVLGEHRVQDFRDADIVVKNPGVRPDSPFLQHARWIESDLSLYFRYAPLQSKHWAVTGTKGKSTTTALLHHIAQRCISSDVQAYGNIGTSPLHGLQQNPLLAILELSSFQIGDLCFIVNQEKTKKTPFSHPLELRFPHALLTNIFPDHLNYYASFDDYIHDKGQLFQFQQDKDHAYVEYGAWKRIKPYVQAQLHMLTTKKALSTSELPPLLSQMHVSDDCLRLDTAQNTSTIPFSAISRTPSLPLLHAAALCIQVFMQYGIPIDRILSAIQNFPGLPHRMQYLGTFTGITIYNDNASTIPQATHASLSQFSHVSFMDKEKSHTRPIIILGGADKNLDIDPIIAIAQKSSALFLAPGSASDRFIAALGKSESTPVFGPFARFDEACIAALEFAKKNKARTLLCSPGATSFHEFEHEFQRGDRFVEIVHSFFNQDTPKSR